MDLELLKHAKEYISKMANGINPLNGEKVKDDDLINNIRISRCLFYVNDVLNDILVNRKKYSKKEVKVPFKMSKDMLSRYNISDEYLSISKIAGKINALKNDDNMANLKGSDICLWLMSIGLLCEIEHGSKKVKVPTDKGRSMGMITEHRITMYKEYDIVLYDRNMQEFIIDNFEYLLEFINKK